VVDVVVLEALGVGIWAVLGLIGAWWLLTGRKTIFRLPRDIREGWPLRVFGLAYVAVTSFTIFQASRGSFSPEAVVFTYLFFAVALVVALSSRRKRRSAEPRPTQP
jgi:hypothetical protein